LESQIIINSHWFIKNEKAIDCREGFPQLPLEKGKQVQKGVIRSFGVWKSFYFVFLEEEENECVRRKLVCYV
jgi:hypothetical protein